MSIGVCNLIKQKRKCILCQCCDEIKGNKIENKNQIQSDKTVEQTVVTVVPPRRLSVLG